MVKEFYTDWARRLSILERARDTTLALHFGAVGYFLKEAIGQNSVILQSPFYAYSWVTFTSLFVCVLCRIALNRYLKSIRAATELMIIEYYSGLPKKGLGYYSFRLTDKREGFLLLGVVPEILSAGYLICILLLFISTKQIVLSALCLIGAIFFIALGVQTNIKIRKSIAKKDYLEGILRKSLNSENIEKEICQFRLDPKGF